MTVGKFVIIDKIKKPRHPTRFPFITRVSFEYFLELPPYLP